MVKYLFLALLIFPLTACQEKEQAPVTQSYHELIIADEAGSIANFKIEIALTPQDQAKGLMHRTQLDEDAGMLFYFGEETEHSFWMKNTLIPLDMLFIKADGTIHHIHENAVPQDLTSIPSRGPVAAVLEINGGMAAKLGIKEGNIVKHPFFSQKSTQ